MPFCRDGLCVLCTSTIKTPLISLILPQSAIKRISYTRHQHQTILAWHFHQVAIRIYFLEHGEAEHIMKHYSGLRSSTRVATVALVASLFSIRAYAQSDTVPVTGILGNATEIQGNPTDGEYVATFANSEVTDIRGQVTVMSATDGNGALITLEISGLPSSGGPFRK